MQRRALRITVGGVLRDVPLGAFSDGQVMTYNAPSNTFEGTTGGGGVGSVASEFWAPPTSPDAEDKEFTSGTAPAGLVLDPAHPEGARRNLLKTPGVLGVAKPNREPRETVSGEAKYTSTT